MEDYVFFQSFPDSELGGANHEARASVFRKEVSKRDHFAGV